MRFARRAITLKFDENIRDLMRMGERGSCQML